MTDRSPTSTPTTCADTSESTCSRESEDGTTPSTSPDGKAPCGPAHAPVSRFRRRDSERAMPINDTSGPLFTTSSPSANLQSSLESRLRARMDVNGSPEYALAWSQWDMPAGPPICRLRASARRISGKDCGGWSSPSAALGEKNVRTEAGAKAEAARKGWTNDLAVAAHSICRESISQTAETEGKRKAVMTAGWPTPMAGTPKQKGYNEAGNTDSGRKTVALAGWATPTTRDHKSGGADLSGSMVRKDGKLRNDLLDYQAAMTIGQTPSGSDAPTGNPGESPPMGTMLNPRFSLWLQGYPTEWASCGEVVIRSSLKSRRNS